MADKIILFFFLLVYFAIFLLKSFFPPFQTLEYLIWLPSLKGLPFFLLLLLLYFLGYKTLRYFTFKTILLGYFIFSFFLLITPPLLSTDLYIYAMRGRIFSIWHQNPYLKVAAEFPSDPFLEPTDKAWRYHPQNYGPLWTLLSAILSLPAKNSLFGTYFLFKFFSFFANTLVLFLIYKISTLYHPQKIKETTFLYAWNPFILIEFVNNAHNDVWMIALGLLGFYFYLKRKNEPRAIFFLTLAGLIKYIYWIFIPLFFILLFKKRNFKKILLALFTVVFFISLAYLPFWEGKKTLEGLMNQTGFKDRSPNQWNLPLMIGIMSLENIFFDFSFTIFVLSIFLWMGRILFLAFYLKFLLQKNKMEIIRFSALSLIVFALLVPGTLLPWYLLWSFPFLVLRKNFLIFFWSAVGLAAYLLFYSTSLSILIFGMGYFLLKIPKIDILKVFLRK